VYVAQYSSFADLVEKAISSECLIDPSHPSIHTTVTFNSAKVKSGSFKLAYVGNTSASIFPDSTSTGVCIKHCYYKNRRKPVIYDPPAQVERLVKEVQCSLWAQGLMELAYNFMRREDEQRGPPPFNIPQLRFVRVALAVDGRFQDAYLLEEVIDEKVDGKFLKYINNDFNGPITYDEHPEREDIGEFLSFVQHVQYEKTGRLAFVSDIQGSPSFLYT
jgi:hypothetical protein